MQLVAGEERRQPGRDFAGMALLRPRNETLRTPEKTPPRLLPCAETGLPRPTNERTDVAAAAAPQQQQRHISLPLEPLLLACSGKKKEGVGVRRNNLVAAVKSFAASLAARRMAPQALKTLSSMSKPVREDMRRQQQQQQQQQQQPARAGKVSSAGEKERQPQHHAEAQRGQPLPALQEQEQPSSQEQEQPLLSVPIEIESGGGGEPLWIDLYEGDDPIAVARSFGQQQGLQEWQQDALEGALAEQYAQAMDELALHSEQAHVPH